MPQTPAGQPLPGAVFELFEVRGDQDHGILAPLDTHSEDMPPGGDAGALHLWLRVHAAPDATPGIYGCLLTLQSGQWSARLPLTLRVHNVALEAPPARGPLRAELWQPWLALDRLGGPEQFSEQWWSYVRDAVSELGRGGGAVQVGRAYFDWRRLGPDNWQFDFTRFDRYVELCEQAGLRGPISYVGMFSTTGPTAIHYTDVDGTAQSVDCEPGSDIYQEAWTAFLEALVAHCAEQGRGSRLVIWPADRPNTDDDRTRFAHAADIVRAADPAIRTAVTADGAENALPLLGHVDIIALLWSVAIDLPAETRQALTAARVELLGYPGPGDTVGYGLALEALGHGLDGLLAPDPMLRIGQTDAHGGGALYAAATHPLPTVAGERLLLGLQDARLLMMLPPASRDGALADLQAAAEDIPAARVALLEAVSRPLPSDSAPAAE